MATTTPISTLTIISKCSIFEFMRYFFCDPQTYSLLTIKCKQSHLFMFYRLMSIKYPVQMNAVSNFHDYRIVDVLHESFGARGNTYPRWLYQKQDKIEQTEKSVLETVSKELIEKIHEVYDIEYKSLLLLYEMDKSKALELIESVQPDDNKVTRRKVNTKKKK